jgi:hypothetical protein
MFLSFGGISREVERRRKNRNKIRYDERDALLEKKHSPESDERHKAAF